MIKYIDGPIKKYLKSPNCKLCGKTENIAHLYIDCKRNKKIWKYFQQYQTHTQKQNTPYPTKYPNNMILVTTTKNKKTNPNTDNHNTDPHMENKKQTTI